MFRNQGLQIKTSGLADLVCTSCRFQICFQNSFWFTISIGLMNKMSIEIPISLVEKVKQNSI